jgi:hypothetical protein
MAMPESKASRGELIAMGWPLTKMPPLSGA